MSQCVNILNNLDNTNVKYVLANIDTQEDYTPMGNIYSDVTLYDLFQSLDVNYLILCVPSHMLPSVFNTYVDSNYLFKYLIPWVKINYDDTSLINVTTKLKYCMDYVVVFQKPLTRNIKSTLQTLIIEPESPFCINEWQKKLIKSFSNIEYEGLFITNSGEVINSNEFLEIKPDVHKTCLF